MATIEADGVVPAIDKIFHFMQGACLQRKTRTCLSYSVINGAFQFIFFENPVGRELEIYKVHEYASIEQYQAGGDHLERIY